MTYPKPHPFVGADLGVCPGKGLPPKWAKMEPNGTKIKKIPIGEYSSAAVDQWKDETRTVDTILVSP